MIVLLFQLRFVASPELEGQCQPVDNVSVSAELKIES
jgi:hypothetical protein